LLAELNRQGWTLPSLGLITRQTIAGATSTGTHGSGKTCLSQFILALRIAACPDGQGTARMIDVTDGPDLAAARCGLGCLGVIVQVTLPIVPQYLVQHRYAFCGSIDDAMALEARTPLQQFFLVPHSWRIVVEERSACDPAVRPRWATLYRLYRWLVFDVLLHWMILLTAVRLRSPAGIRWLYRGVVPWSICPWWTARGRSDLMLTMEHERYRHLELEAFVQRRHLTAGLAFVQEVLQATDDPRTAPSEALFGVLDAHGLRSEFDALRGTWTHHYPICVRRVVADDTLLSMASANDSHDDWYAISLVTYVEPREPFLRVATLIARGLLHEWGGRVHWGKWNPLTGAELATVYPHLPQFRAIARRFDPDGVFVNAEVRARLTFSAAPARSASAETGP
jgi:FAD/FMN-containing dehydrogenase